MKKYLRVRFAIQTAVLVLAFPFGESSSAQVVTCGAGQSISLLKEAFHTSLEDQVSRSTHGESSTTMESVSTYVRDTGIQVAAIRTRSIDQAVGRVICEGQATLLPTPFMTPLLPKLLAEGKLRNAILREPDFRGIHMQNGTFTGSVVWALQLTDDKKQLILDLVDAKSLLNVAHMLIGVELAQKGQARLPGQ